MTAYRYVIAGFGAAALVFWFVFKTGERPVAQRLVPGDAIVNIDLPTELSANAQVGGKVFETACASCHGDNAVGQEGVAPPLVHVIYEPSHHGDEAFQRAVAIGVRQHHWPLGDMPAVDGLTRGDVAMITAFVRELQRANAFN